MTKPISQTNTIARAPGRAIAIIMLCAAAIGIGACSNPPTQVDPGFFPEGQLDPDARLVLWFEQPNVVTIYQDFIPLGSDPRGDLCGLPVKGFEDTLVGVELRQSSSPGTIRGVIVDGTRASAYQIFRREMGGGFRQYQDFNAERFRQWLFSGWEAFRFVDRTPSGMSPASYVGRGIVEGTVTPRSPLTNASELTMPTIPEIVMTSPQRPRDSLFVVEWQPVTGAAGYFLQIYDLPPIPPDEAVQRGAPAPFFDGDVNEVFSGYLEAPSTTYQIGDTTRTDIDLFMRRSTFFSRIYIVRVTAVDATGQMLATTRGSNGIVFGEVELPDSSIVDGYGLFPLGGIAVCPTEPSAAIESDPALGALPALLADGRVAWRVPRLRYTPK